MFSLYPLRQNTAQTVLVGPFANKIDGITPVTNVTLASLTSRHKIQNGVATDLAARTFTHVNGGSYDLSLLSGDVATLGFFRLMFAGPSVCTMSWRDCLVLDPDLYDAYMTVGGLVLLSPQITLSPITMSQNPLNVVGSPVLLAAFVGETKTFSIAAVDAANDPVVLTGKTLRFVVETQEDVPTPVKTVEAADISLQDGGTLVLIETVCDFAVGAYQWRLWNDTDHVVVAYGPFTELPASESEA